VDQSDDSEVKPLGVSPWAAFGRSLRSEWRRIAGPPPELEPSDVIAPEALPICPECTQRYHPLAYRCHRCGEPVGVYRTLLYPDWVWIWGRGLWRLMRRKSASGLVWVGMVVLALGWLGWFWPALHPRYGAELGWLARPMLSIWLALSLIPVVAGVRMMVKAWRLRGTWRGAGWSEVVTTAGEGSEVGGEEG